MSQTSLSTAPPRGMRDFLPQETAIRDWASNTILSTYEQFGFTRIETPALENIAMLRRSEGGENLQLIFEVLKRGDKLERELASGQLNRADLADLGLRFDLTVPLVRFFSNNQNNLPFPLKAIQIGSVWRAESPQQGRFRQFTQCDIDVIGIKDEMAEAELLHASAEALLSLHFENFKIRINDRRILSSLVEQCGFTHKPDSVFIAIDKLDKVGMDGVRKELQDDGHPKEAVDNLIAILQGFSMDAPFEKQRQCLPAATDAKVVDGLQRVIDTVGKLSGGRYETVFDLSLVRGMGYYTGQIFEIGIAGYPHSVGGGGRYDRMIGKLSGRDVPACGFSIGFERIIGILMERGFVPPNQSRKVALIYDPERDEIKAVLQAAQNLRSKGHVVSVQPRKKDMRKQLDSLMSFGFGYHCGFRGDPDNLELKELRA